MYTYRAASGQRHLEDELEHIPKAMTRRQGKGRKAVMIYHVLKGKNYMCKGSSLWVQHNRKKGHYSSQNVHCLLSRVAPTGFALSSISHSKVCLHSFHAAKCSGVFPRSSEPLRTADLATLAMMWSITFSGLFLKLQIAWIPKMKTTSGTFVRSLLSESLRKSQSCSEVESEQPSQKKLEM